MIHSIAVWKTALTDVSAWTASTFLLSSLAGYQGALDNGGSEDREQTYNFLIAWRLSTPATKVRKISGPIPITRLSPQQWRNAFAELNAAAAAELLVETYLTDPLCGFGDAVAILASALAAWGDVQVSQHKLGGRGDKAEPGLCWSEKPQPGLFYCSIESRRVVKIKTPALIRRGLSGRMS
jgi:hypothetical protein